MVARSRTRDAALPVFALNSERAYVFASKVVKITGRKEVKIMTYNKPEIAVVGEATNVICASKVNFGSIDGLYVTPSPAYELDEE